MPDNPYPHDATVSFTFRELFDKIDRKLDLINSALGVRLEGLEGRMTKMESRTTMMDAIQSHLPALDERLTHVERKLDKEDGGKVALKDGLTWVLGLATLVSVVTAVVAALN